MKRLVISCILILALTNLAYAMGSHHGGGGRSANVSSSGSGGSSTGGSDSGTSNTTPNGTANTANNSPAGGNPGVVGGQGSTGGGPIIVGSSSPTCVRTPELTTIFLLGSALLGLWGFRRKIKK